MIKNISFLLVAMFVLASCTKQEAKATYLEGESIANNSNTVQNAKNRATGMLMPNQTATVSNAQQMTPQQVQQMQQQGNVIPTSGMNPPHGKPGHRCDIAVGAPLNSTPKTTTPTTTSSQTQQITVNPTKSTAASQKTPPGMNPPHGEPGHRCDIAVGAPLASPPGKNSEQTLTPTTPPAKTLPATVAAPSATTANTNAGIGADGKKLAVNPAHGEPGHSCAIAVGAPFK